MIAITSQVEKILQIGYREAVHPVNTTILLQKLIDIERAIGTETNQTILDRVFDAEDCVLQMQRELIEKLRNEPRHEIAEKLLNRWRIFTAFDTSNPS